jgi:hypothetical protein
MRIVQGLLVVMWIAEVATFTPGIAQKLWATTAKTAPLFYRNQKDAKSFRVDDHVSIHRFDRTASQARQVDQPCILIIDNVRYNVTAWGT